MDKVDEKILKNTKKSQLIFRVFVGIALVLFAIPIILAGSVFILGLCIELHSAFLVIMITFIGIEILWALTLISGQPRDKSD